LALEKVLATGATVVRVYPQVPILVARVTRSSLEALLVSPFVDFIEPVELAMPLLESAGLENALTTGGQDTSWALQKVRVPEVWASIYGPSNRGEWASVTMIDMGLDSVQSFAGDGPEGLGPNCYYIADSRFPTETSCFSPRAHGSQVAAIVAAKDNLIGSIGVAHNLWQFSSIRVCNYAGGCDTEWLVQAIIWAAERGYPRHVLNISLGICVPLVTLESAVAYALSRGVLVVSSAGNAWSDSNYCPPSKTAPAIGFEDVMYPARYPGVLAVGGLLDDDSPAPTGPRPTPPPPGGPENPTCPADICAPQSVVCNGLGTRRGAQVTVGAPFVVRTLSGSSLEPVFKCGTSLSSPIVAGVAALVWSRNPAWSAAQVRARISEAAVALPAAWQMGGGAVDAVRAVHLPPVTASIRGPQFVTVSGNYAWTLHSNAVGAPVTWYLATAAEGPFHPISSSSSAGIFVSPSLPPRLWLRVEVGAASGTATDEIVVFNETGNPCSPLVC
jgi:thermitase